MTSEDGAKKSTDKKHYPKLIDETDNTEVNSTPQVGGGGGGGGGGVTLNFSAYVGSDPAFTLYPPKISGISNTPKNI